MRSIPCVVALILACGSHLPTRGLGVECTDSSQCAVGLDCLDNMPGFVSSDDAGCVGSALEIKICTIACEMDSHCTATGAMAVCQPNGCQKAGFCLSKP